MSIRYDSGNITNYVRHTLARIAPKSKEIQYTDKQTLGRDEEWLIEVLCSLNNIKDQSYNADIIVTDYPCSYNNTPYKIKFSIYIHKCFLKNEVNENSTIENIYLHGFKPEGLTYPQLAEIEEDIRQQIISSWDK